MKALNAVLKKASNRRRTQAHGREGILRAERGQSLIELAMITPLVLLLLVGVIELGWFAYLDILVANAARAGAAYASQGTAQATPNNPGIQGAVNYDFGTQYGTLTATSSNACGCDTGGTVTTESCSIADTRTVCGAIGPNSHWVVAVTVNVSGTFSWLLPLPSYAQFSNRFTLTKSCTMRVAQQ
jgi:Flp pilus assembly protein TadG